MRPLEYDFSYSRGDPQPFGQYCTEATVTPAGLLTVVRHMDLAFTVLEKRDLAMKNADSKSAFEQLTMLINDWSEEYQTGGLQWEEYGEYAIRYNDKSAFWTDSGMIQAPKLKQLALWLHQNILCDS